MDKMSGVRNPAWSEEPITTEEQAQKIQAELDSIRPTYQSARIALAGEAANGSIDQFSKKKEYEEAVRVYELMEEHLAFYKQKQSKENQEALVSDAQEVPPTIH